MRELNEQELEQVAGGFGYWASGSAEAGSIVNIRKGVVSSVSGASVLVTPLSVVAGASNATLATGKFSADVSSGASTSATIVH